MIVVENQQPGDLWVVNGERYTVTNEPRKTPTGYYLRMVDANQNPYVIYVDLVADEL